MIITYHSKSPSKRGTRDRVREIPKEKYNKSRRHSLGKGGSALDQKGSGYKNTTIHTMGAYSGYSQLCKLWLLSLVWPIWLEMDNRRLGLDCRNGSHVRNYIVLEGAYLKGDSYGDRFWHLRQLDSVISIKLTTNKKSFPSDLRWVNEGLGNLHRIPLHILKCSCYHVFPKPVLSSIPFDEKQSKKPFTWVWFWEH